MLMCDRLSSHGFINHANSPYPYDTINTLKSKNPRPRSTAILPAQRAKKEIHQTFLKPNSTPLATETIQSSSLALQGIDNIERSNSLA